MTGKCYAIFDEIKALVPDANLAEIKNVEGANFCFQFILIMICLQRILRHWIYLFGQIIVCAESAFKILVNWWKPLTAGKI